MIYIIGTFICFGLAILNLPGVLFDEVSWFNYAASLWATLCGIWIFILGLKS